MGTCNIICTAYTSKQMRGQVAIAGLIFTRKMQNTDMEEQGNPRHDTAQIRERRRLVAGMSGCNRRSATTQEYLTLELNET